MVGPPLSLTELGESFELYRPFLDDLHERFSGMETDEIRRRLMERSATLHRVSDVGFVVCQWMGTSCYVLSAYAFMGRVDCIVEVFNEFQEYAKSLGITEFSFSSPRKGWARIAKKCGMTETIVTYSKEI